MEDAPWRPLAFSAGNPRAEIIHGELHLFRDTLTAAASSSGPTGDVGDDADALPRGRHPTVCVLAVPSSLSVGDFCRFVAAFAPSMVEMRMVAPSGEDPDEGTTETDDATTTKRVAAPRLPKPGSSYSVILRFADQESADAFARNYHDRKFNAFCEEKCRVLFVRRVEVTAGQTKAERIADGAPARDDGDALVELPSCPVCLDRLDNEASGVVTTVCSHAFHASCMSNWEDNSCPVCRYTTSPDAVTACHCPGCEETSETAALWACLICGSVGCGRYDGKHALEHWRESGHCYAMELRTQRVWDYVRDGFVHRLIQSKAGLVELTRGPRGGGGGAAASGAPPGLRAAAGEAEGASASTSFSKRRGGGGGGGGGGGAPDHARG